MPKLSHEALVYAAEQAHKFSGLPVRQDLPTVSGFDFFSAIEALSLGFTHNQNIAAAYRSDLNTVQIPDGFNINAAKDRSTLVHEMTHFLQFGPQGPYFEIDHQPLDGEAAQLVIGKVEGQAYLTQMKWAWQFGMTPLVTHGLYFKIGWKLFDPHMSPLHDLTFGPWHNRWKVQSDELEDLTDSQRSMWIENEWSKANAKMLASEGRY